MGWPSLSHGVLGGPLLGELVVLGAVGLEEAGDVGDERVVGVGVGEERADGEEDLGDGESGRPGLLEDVETDRAVGVDVGVEDASGEGELGRLEGVVGGEVDAEEEDSSVVGRALGSHDARVPLEFVVAHGTGRAVGGRVLLQVRQLLLDSAQCHYSLLLFKKCV